MIKQSKKDDDKLQLKLPFFGTYTEPNPREEKKKSILQIEADEHLEKFIRLFLILKKGNSFELNLIFAYILRFIQKRLESKYVCYLKLWKNSQYGFYKKYYCRGSIDKWRKCPEKFCPIWYSDSTLKCPYDEQTDNITKEEQHNTNNE